MKIILFALCILSFADLRAQLITTVIGNHASGNSGNGGPALLASITDPESIAIDGMGNVYINDESNHVIRKISSSGIISLFAGNGTQGFSGDGGLATAAQLNGPCAIAADALGNIYIADQYNYRIRKVNTLGIISTFAGNGGNNLSGNGLLATSAQIGMPVCLAIDSVGNVYFGDWLHDVVRKISTSGIINAFAGTGTSGYNGDGINAASAKLYQPVSLAIDKLGNVYIGDYYNYRIRKVNTSGIISTFAGTGNQGNTGNNGLATSAEIVSPNGIAIDEFGNVYFSDSYDNNIRKVNSFGIISRYCGTPGSPGYSGDGGPASSAEVAEPTGLAFDAAGNLYIADKDNHVIRKAGNCIAPVPSICMIQVDSLSQNNIIYWDKTPFPSADTFYVYRDTSNNNYALVGKVANSALSMFVDTARYLYAANGDPNVTSWRYKISYYDTCSNTMSPMSPWHQTIYQYNIGGLFIWNHYEIEGQPTPVPGLQNYLLKRDNIANGTFITAATASASSTNINDTQYATYASTADWRIETLWSISCNPTMRLGSSGKESDIQAVIVKSKSNIKTNRMIGISEIRNQALQIKVYPNPANGIINVELLTGNEEGMISLENLLGQTVYSAGLTKGTQKIVVSNFETGIYLVKVKTKIGLSIQKVVVE